MTIENAIKELVELGNLLGMDAVIYTRNDIGTFTPVDTITHTVDNQFCVIDGERDDRRGGVRPQ